MKTITLQNRNTTFETNLVSCYSELSFVQLIQIATLYKDHLTQITQVQKDAMMIALFPFMCDPKPPMKFVNDIPAMAWVDLYPHLEWIFETPRFKEWPHKSLDNQHKDLLPPVEMLRTSSILEMTTMDDSYVLAAGMKDFDKIYHIAATLFRPKRKDLKEFKQSPKWNGDSREPFNQLLARNRAEKYKKTLSETTATAVFLFAKSFHDIQLVEGFKNLFPEQETETKAVRVGNNYGWPGVILEYSNTKFGDLEKTSQENWYTFLFEMSRQVDISKQKSENLK